MRDDYQQTRLTHSLSCSSVGRELGFQLWEFLHKEGHLPSVALPQSPQKQQHKQQNSLFSKEDLAAILETACLAHDIGNPPFGHKGEDAIASFFKLRNQNFNNPFYNSDLNRYEGNAAGFHILATLGLTCASFGAYLKYPCNRSTQKDDPPSDARYTKKGIFCADERLVHVINEQCHIPQVADEYWELW